MTKKLYYEFFYYHSIPEMLLWGVLLVGAWTVLAILIKPKHPKLWRNLNRIVLVAVVFFILYWTLGKRNPSENGASLIPFYSFIAARSSSERYRSVIANILLFIPIGLTLPFLFRLRRPILTTILFSLVLSTSIELIQFLFGLGLCEVDDVIFNTLGAAFGTVSYILTHYKDGMDA